MRKFIWHKLFAAAVVSGALMLSACSGGGGASGSTSSSSGVTSPVQTVTGIAATGLPLVAATITLKDSLGVTASTTSASDGSFSIVVTGMKPPFMLRAEKSDLLGTNSLYSILPAMDMTIKNTATVNLTTVTTLVMYELSNGGDPGDTYRTNGFTSMTSVNAVGIAETTVRGRLATLSTVSKGFSMMFDSFTAGSSDPYDAALDATGNITSYNLAASTVTLQTTAAAHGNVVTRSYLLSSAASVTPKASAAQVLVSSPQMPSSGANPVGLTVVVLDNNGQTMAGRTVKFAVHADPAAVTLDPSAYLSGIKNISDANGLASANLNLGQDKTNRRIYVSASVDDIIQSNSVDVTGTTISASGNTSLVYNSSSVLSISVKDSAGTAISGAKVTVASANGNTIVTSPTDGKTDSSGAITATVTASASGSTSDTISIGAQGATKTVALIVSPDSFNFASPATASTVDLGKSQPLSVIWRRNGNPVSGQQITFTASRGTLSPGTATTDSTGTASTNISSNTGGLAVVTATGSDATSSPSSTLNLEFVATSVSSITPQANPGTIQVTSGSSSQTNNSSAISVIVRDANNNLVKNALVQFTITKDPSGGRLTSGTAITDSYGSASVNYIAGNISSPQNGVTITASVASVANIPVSPSVSNFVDLTVSGQSLFVRLGTDNVVIQDKTPNFTKIYSAIVTDSAGNPVPAGTSVSFVLRPGQYRKGKWFIGICGTAPCWTPQDNVTCPNEDKNFNGIIDLNEDFNQNNRLDPGGVAAVNASGVTDQNGVALATITYPASYGHWTEVILEARTGVAGNDPPTQAKFDLPYLAKNALDVTVNMPGNPSPFGEGDPAAFPPNDTCANDK